MDRFYTTCVEPIADRISIYDGPDVFLRQFKSVESWLGDLFATIWADYEIRNGGFLQFFQNSTGVLAPEAQIGFDRIGLPDLAGIVQKAMNFFGEEYPRDRRARNNFIVQHQRNNPGRRDLFDSLDEEYYTSKNERFEDMADAYARRFTRSN